MKNYFRSLPVFAATIALSAGLAFAQPTWKLINPSTSGGVGGSGTACAYTMTIPVFSRMVPVATTIQYNIIGGGGGNGGRGGQGGDTYILVNGVTQASASGGSNDNNGSVSQGSVTLSEGDFLEIRVGGGGGGSPGCNADNGRDAVDGLSGTSGTGYRGAGGGGGWGSGGGRGSINCSTSGQSGGSDGAGSPGATSSPATGIRSGQSRGLAGTSGNYGGQAGFVDISYSSSGCWIQ